MSHQDFHLRSYNKAVKYIVFGFFVLVFIPLYSDTYYGLAKIDKISFIFNYDIFVNIKELFNFINFFDLKFTIYGYNVYVKHIITLLSLFVFYFSILQYRFHMKRYKNRFYGQTLEKKAIESLKSSCIKYNFSFIDDDTVYAGIGDIDAIIKNGSKIFTIEIKSQRGCLKSNNLSISRLNGKPFVKDYIQQTINSSRAYYNKCGQNSIPLLWFPNGKSSCFRCNNVIVVNGSVYFLTKIIKES